MRKGDIAATGVKAKRFCSHCQGEVKKGFCTNHRDGEEYFYVWICQNPDCQHYNDAHDGVRAQAIITCPKCHQEAPAHCFAHDIGMGNDFNDRYYLYCETCGVLEYVTLYGGLKDSVSEEVTYCPYCGLSVYAHQDAPPEVQELFKQAGADLNDGYDFSLM